MLSLFPEQASTISGEIDSLFMLITYLVGFWFVVAEAVLLYMVFRHRRKPSSKAQYIEGNNRRQLAWVFVPVALIVICDLWIDIETTRVWNRIKLERPPAEQKVRVITQQWSWMFIHPGPDGQLDTADDIVTANELHVSVNTPTHYELESRDVVHNFSVPVFRIKQDAIPGRVISGWFEATRTGRYDIQCAEMCGIGHGLMRASVVVETPENYEQWMASALHEQKGLAFAANGRTTFASLLNRSFHKPGGNNE